MGKSKVSSTIIGSIMRRHIAFLGALVALAFIIQSAASAAVFYGITRHVSTTNIKVYDPKSHQTLGFALFPKFKNVFSDDGKTTYQMSAIKAGQYVKVYYDQHAFGIRHADKIYIMTSSNRKVRAE